MTLSPLDGVFLSLETPKDHLNIGLVGVFDPATGPGDWSWQQVHDLIAARLDRMPLLRQRLAHVPLGLTQPLWVDDEHFDLDAHLHRAAVPPPGSVRELAELSAAILSHPMDLERPLWELWTVEGLEGGRVAFVLKSHHAALDGIAIAELGLHLTDPAPITDDERPPAGDGQQPSAWRPSPPPSLARRSAHVARGLLAQPAAATRAATGAAARLRRVLSGTATPSPLPLTAPRTPFNGHVSCRRTAAFSSLAMAEVQAVREAAGATTNDVVLATCAGALRQLLEDADTLPEKPLLALVPRSVRREDDPQGRSNRIVPMLVPVPTHLDAPLERLRAASAAAGAAKARAADDGHSPLLHLSELAAPGVAARLSRLYADLRLADHHPPLFNLTISNVPGPDVPLYSAGAKMQAVFPMGPVYEGTGLNITVTSYLDQLHVGVVACPARVPDPWALTEHLRDALRELTKAATAAPRLAPTRR